MITESELRTVLASRFGKYTIRERVRVGENHTVFDVTVDGRRAACKMTESQPEALTREGTVLRVLAEQTPIRVPEVLGMGEGYLLLEWVEGQTYDPTATQEACKARLRDVGRTLARLHNSTQKWFVGHGTLSREDGSLSVSQPVDWSDRFATFVNEWASELVGTEFADVGTAVTETVEMYRDTFTDRSPVLVHGEASPDHVLFDGQGAVTLIDWELSQAAPGAFDLVWAERDLLGRPIRSDESTQFRRTLINGYESERELGPEFRFHRELYRAAFAMRELTLVTDSDTLTGSGEDGTALRKFVYDRLNEAEMMGPASSQ